MNKPGSQQTLTNHVTHTVKACDTLPVQCLCNAFNNYYFHYIIIMLWFIIWSLACDKSSFPED